MNPKVIFFLKILNFIKGKDEQKLRKFWGFKNSTEDFSIVENISIRIERIDLV